MRLDLGTLKIEVLATKNNFSLTVVHYRVLMGYFRKSPRGSHNLVSPGAGTFVPEPVCDERYTL